MAHGDRELVIGCRHAVPLRRAAGAAATVAGYGYFEIPATRELVEMVASDVGMEGELIGDLSGGDAVVGASKEEDVSSGRITEGGRSTSWAIWLSIDGLDLE